MVDEQGGNERPEPAPAPAPEPKTNEVPLSEKGGGYRGMDVLDSTLPPAVDFNPAADLDAPVEPATTNDSGGSGGTGEGSASDT